MPLRWRWQPSVSAFTCRTTQRGGAMSAFQRLRPGQFYDVLVDDSDLYDLYGTVAK